jgi:hypothetical protein
MFSFLNAWKDPNDVVSDAHEQEGTFFTSRFLRSNYHLIPEYAMKKYV